MTVGTGTQLDYISEINGKPAYKTALI